MSEIISVRHLRKTFKVPLPYDGENIFDRIKHFVVNPSTDFTAVDDLSFAVDSGEVLGFLGANGSGKSTTIKMLTGILTPTAGEVEVLGYTPHRQRLLYTPHIGVVLGQKSLLWWNIPVIESFKLYRDIYGQSDRDFEERLRRFTQLLEITDILHVPVRKLSLGLRMRSEIVASLLHMPRVIFLDEPTIGLDVRARLNLKRFLRRINEELGITIFLTTHNMLDIEDLCRRCIILNRGQKIYDGRISVLKAREEFKILEFEIIKIRRPGKFNRVLRRCHILEREDFSFKLRIPGEDTVDIIDELFAACSLSNLNVVPPTLESIIEKIFTENSGKGAGDVAQASEIAA